MQKSPRHQECPHSPRAAPGVAGFFARTSARTPTAARNSVATSRDTSLSAQRRRKKTPPMPTKGSALVSYAPRQQLAEPPLAADIAGGRPNGRDRSPLLAHRKVRSTPARMLTTFRPKPARWRRRCRRAAWRRSQANSLATRVADRIPGSPKNRPHAKHRAEFRRSRTKHPKRKPSEGGCRGCADLTDD